jgi:hypothetical protein
MLRGDALSCVQCALGGSTVAVADDSAYGRSLCIVVSQPWLGRELVLQCADTADQQAWLRALADAAAVAVFQQGYISRRSAVRKVTLALALELKLLLLACAAVVALARC